MGFQHISNKWVTYFGRKTLGGVSAPLAPTLLRDEFVTDDAAPVASPRTCEPGPGALTITDPGNLLSIASGTIKYASIGANPSIGSIGIQATALARVPGRALMASARSNVTLPAYPIWVGWWRDTDLNYTGGAHVAHGIYSQSSQFYTLANVSSIIPLPNAALAGVDYGFAIVLCAVGAYYFIKVSATWTLIWVGESDATDPIYPTLAPANSGGAADIAYDFMRVRDLSGVWAAANGLALVDATTAVSGTAYTGAANGIHDLTMTAPNPLSDSCELRTHVTDDNNYWTSYFNALASFRVDSVASGIATNRVNVASTIAAGATRTIREISNGSLHDFYTLSGTTWTKRGSQVNLSHQNTSTAVKPVAGAGWVLGALRSYPCTSVVYSELDKT